jgi:glycosyltransferase involved in cell wall biosynthesis
MVFCAKKLLLLTKQLDTTLQGGRELLCLLNYDVLHSLYAGRLVLWELRDDRRHGVSGILDAFRGHIDGLDVASIEAALMQIRESRVTQVFVDGSNLGGFVAVLKRRLPAIEVVTFFHNVEARFFFGSWRLHKTLHALGVLVANALAEHKSVKFSDKIVCLSDRDSRLLKRLYGRGATHIAPMVLEDKCPASFLEYANHPPERFALFVGGMFYANRAGIAWFVREVVPKIDLPIYIVGRGFEALRAELEVPDKVMVIGSVDSLADWYRRAQFVIAPIFDGSGMKTKVAEALMYGKKVIGTPEAFAGYDGITDQAGWVCESAHEFVAAIAAASVGITQSFDPALRKIYEKSYSMKAAKARFAKILS